MSLDAKFWNGTRWNGHAAHQTIGHIHVSHFPSEDGRSSCDIMVVECADGRWYVEDNWGDDAQGAEGVWNPFDPCDAGPRFFESEDAALRHAVAVVAAVTGASETDLLKQYLEV